MHVKCDKAIEKCLPWCKSTLIHLVFRAPFHPTQPLNTNSIKAGKGCAAYLWPIFHGESFSIWENTYGFSRLSLFSLSLYTRTKIWKPLHSSKRYSMKKLLEVKYLVYKLSSSEEKWLLVQFLWRVRFGKCACYRCVKKSKISSRVLEIFVMTYWMIFTKNYI